ncbi:hypothetical protein Lesp02_42850 [Lentzea sp. NBRC 105346]|uniref:hypothetical protein n=1 Tax=Lentzea sp. NBRC 105346 TaxID=3032205 RepID=UPI0024A3E174|nr:hypothetical protein [Lentzea sp. NBRC 105346]GLZ32097.1 hypothetical protein Lesp02_42850 [Lentzea sp. NBRC 105346]
MVRRNGTIWFGGDDRFIELMHALTHPEEQWAHPERPDILLALDELSAWAHDSRIYDERVHKSGWSSAIADFLGAAEALGPVLSASVRFNIDALRALVRSDVGGDANLRSDLMTAASALRLVLADAKSLSAAWQDLLKACGRKESSFDTIAIRRDTFWAMARAADRNVDELSRNLTSILSGSPLGAYSAMLHVDPANGRQITASEIRDAQLIAPVERLQMVDAMLTAAPRIRSHVVWFAFRNAYMNTVAMLELPSFQFFEARWVRGNLEHDDAPHRDQIPAELREHGSASSIPDKPDVVLARVDLGSGAFSDAVRIAGERLDELLGMSSIGRAAPWERIPGFIHFQGESGVSDRVFEYSQSPSISPESSMNAGAQISRMVPRVAPFVPVQDPAMRDIIDSLHWWRVGSDQASAASVVLDVRVIELIASRAGEAAWTTYLEKYTKNLWIRSAVIDAFSRPLYEALHYRAAVRNPRQREIFLETMKYEEGEQYFDIRKAAGHLDEIIGFVPENLPLSRDLRTVRRRSTSSSSMKSWCKALEKQWQGWVHRLERVRNSISHGGPFTERAVALTQPFSRKLSVWMLWECVDCYLDGKTVVQAHDDIKSRSDSWRNSMNNLKEINDIFEF